MGRVEASSGVQISQIGHGTDSTKLGGLYFYHSYIISGAYICYSSRQTFFALRAQMMPQNIFFFKRDFL